MYDYVRTRLKKIAGQVAHLPRTLSLVWAAASRFTVAWAVLLIIQGLLPVATVYLTRALVDALVIAVRANGVWPTIRLVLRVALEPVPLRMALWTNSFRTSLLVLRLVANQR